jgi:hypothetical protein
MASWRSRLSRRQLNQVKRQVTQTSFKPAGKVNATNKLHYVIEQHALDEGTPDVQLGDVAYDEYGNIRAPEGIGQRDRVMVGTAPREDGLTARQTKSKMKTRLRRAARWDRYKKVKAGLYESGLKFQVPIEHMGSMAEISSSVSPGHLKWKGVNAGDYVMIIGAAEDWAHENRNTNVMHFELGVIELPTSWLVPVVEPDDEEDSGDE